MVLNSGQQNILNEAVRWFNSSSDQVFEIDGLAGTGKTVLISAILQALGLRIEEFMPMAYTGQASIVMRTRGFITAKSIHSSLYEYVTVMDDNSRINKAFGISGTKKVFRKKEKVPDTVRLFFIDEAYMVPDYMVKDILSFGIKVIVAGDCHQLPPIGGKPGFLVDDKVHHLTQLMRQAENSPIIYLSQRAINGEPIHCGMYGNQVMVIEDDEFIPEMVLFADCICCGTNATRDYYNKYIRTLAHLNEYTIPQCGERVICKSNDWDVFIDDIALANGLCGTVITPPDITKFRRDTFFIDFKPDLSTHSFKDIPINYEYFISDAKRRSEMRSMDKQYIQGEFFEFAYCLTTHSAQGSEYNNLIFIEEYLHEQSQKQYLYTGITRAKQKLIYIKHHRKYY